MDNFILLKPYFFLISWTVTLLHCYFTCWNWIWWWKKWLKKFDWPGSYFCISSTCLYTSACTSVQKRSGGPKISLTNIHDFFWVVFIKFMSRNKLFDIFNFFIQHPVQFLLHIWFNLKKTRGFDSFVFPG